MAPGWEMGMGLGIDFGMEFESASVSASAPTAMTSGSPAYMYGLPSTDTLRIDDLLDFSNHDFFPSSAAPTTDTHLLPPPVPSSAAGSRPFTTAETESSSDYHNPHLSNTFPDDLYIPCEEAAELEWLSKFVEDSFSDIPYPSSTTGHLLAPSSVDANPRTDPSSVPGRGARSKRSRAPGNTAGHPHHHQLATTWSSLSPQPPPQQSSSSSTTSSSSSSDFPSPMPKESSNSTNSSRKMKGGVEGVVAADGGVRRCTHCASEKTPQWRTGPLGPKTLCNACGVRYKSGRLVPEYRPAASPTFMLTQHSNSHRKVMELRRQKELLVLRHDSHPSSTAAARPDLLFHDYEVC